MFNPSCKRALGTATRTTRARIANRWKSTLAVDNPFTGETYCEVKMMDDAEVAGQIMDAKSAQLIWKDTTLEERIQVCKEFLEYFKENESQVTKDITGMMGKPLTNSKGEIGGMTERAIAMMDLAPKALEEVVMGPTTNNQDTTNFHRSIVREPVGVVLTLAPWNFPLLTAVNSIVPAVLAGNAVVVNHGFRTPLISEHFAQAFQNAGVPKGLVCSQKCDYETLHQAIQGGMVDFVSFTGSVAGGRAVNKSVGDCINFIDCTLELGGNDGVYVAPDANLDVAVATVVDGGLYNAGQSCCGIERAFVHESIYDEFLERAKAEVASAYGKVGDPLDPETNMGPLAQPQAISHLTGLIKDAKEKGARVLCGEDGSGSLDRVPRVFQPTLLADCDCTMEVMYEESFGPIIAIEKVSNQKEAIENINRSKYGLTSAIFTNNRSKAEEFASQVDAGTIFMNRADYLDPYLAWQGRKDTGKGVSLSQFGFSAFTKLKNHHFKFV